MDEVKLIRKARQLYGTRDTLDEIVRRGKLRVMVEFTAPPSQGPPPECYYSELTGEPSGIACDLGRLLARDLGVQVEWVDIPWKEQLEAFLEGAADILPKHTNTPTRAAIVDFSVFKFHPLEILAVTRKSGPIKSMEDINSTKTRIVVWHGSSNYDLATNLFPDADVFEHGKHWDVLVKGEADVMVDIVTQIALDRFDHLDLVRNHKGERIVLSTEYGHPAVFPGDAKFLSWINNFMSFHWAKGNIGRIIGEWESWMAR